MALTQPRFIMGVFLALSVLTCSPDSPDLPEADLAFINVSVYTFTEEGIIYDATVLVREGKIIGIEKNWNGRAKLIIDWGGTIMPGLANMHVYLERVQNPDILLYSLYNGVTTIRVMNGRPEHLVWRNEINAGNRIGPYMIVGGPAIESSPPARDDARVAKTPGEGVDAVREQHAAGYDFINVGDTLEPDTYKAVVAEASRLGLPVAGHIPRDVGLSGAIASGQGFVENFSGYLEEITEEGSEPPPGLERFAFRYFLFESDAEKVAEIAAETTEAGVVNTPMLVTQRSLVKALENQRISIPELDNFSGDVLDFWFGVPEGVKECLEEGELNALKNGLKDGLTKKYQLVKTLHEAGAPLLLGAPAGLLFEEIEAFVDAGISRAEAVQIAVQAPADHFPGVPGGGRIAVGESANFLLIWGNPLGEYVMEYPIVAIMLGSKFLEPKDISQRILELEWELGLRPRPD